MGGSGDQIQVLALDGLQPISVILTQLHQVV